MLSSDDNNNNGMRILILLLLLLTSPSSVLSSTTTVCGPGYEILPGSSTGDTFLIAGEQCAVFSFSYSGSGTTVGAQTIVAGMPFKKGYADGIGNSARFTYLTSMVVLPSSEDIVVVDSKNHVLRKINAASKQVTTFAGVAHTEIVTDFIDGPGNISTFSAMGRLSVTEGRVYVAVPPLRMVTFPELVVSTLYMPYALGTSDGFLSSPGTASDVGRMTNSFTASISPSGTFFILSDSIYHTIRRLDLLESRVSTIAGTVGSQGCLDGTGTNAQFYNPSKILVTSNNSLIYIADVKNLALRVMDLQTLQVWTLTGTCPPAVKPAMSSGYRASIAIQDMVLSSDETFIVAISDINGNLASIRLDTGLVRFLYQEYWTYSLWWLSISMIPAKGSSCRACGQGTYSSNGAICVQCSAGMLCDVGSGSQTPCPVGYSCANASLMKACELPGSFCPAGSQNQTLCPEGYFCVNASNKIVCTQGNFCPSGSVNQTLCPEGYFCTNTTVKFKCELGNLCPAGSTRKTICPAGFFCGNFSSQTQCMLGSFCPAGSFNQNACPFGHYCPSTDTCLICPTNGDEDVVSCPPGSIAPIPLANNSFCVAGKAPQGGVRDIIVWVGVRGIQSMFYDRTSDIGVGGAVELISGSEATEGNVDGVGGAARFKGLSSALVLPFSTELIVADKSNSVLKLVNFKSKNVTTILNVINVGGVYQNIDGIGSSASISFPVNLLMAKNSDIIYVFTLNTIRMVTYPGMVVSSFPVSGISSYSVKPSISSDGKFFIISNFVTNVVYKLDLKTYVVLTVGSPVNGCVNGVGTDVRFDYPSVSVILSNGTLAYISDNFNYGIRILDTDTLAVTSLVGTCPRTTPTETHGYRISIGWVDAMVLSVDESYLIVLLTYTRGISRIDLTTGYVNPITPSSGFFYAGMNLALVPNIPPPCLPCDPGWHSTEGLRCDICPSGYFCQSISSAPSVCNLGSLCPAGSTQETPCAEGSFCPNASISLICQAGSFCPLRSVFPTVCVLHQYCPDNSSAAVLCPIGSFCKDPSSIKECGIGVYCMRGSTSETLCALGNFCPNASMQLPCPLGSFCPLRSVFPILCVLQQYCPDNSSAAVLCPVGSFCKDPSSIKECGIGAYCMRGSTSETLCALGNFCPNASMQLPCPLGSFCPLRSVFPIVCVLQQYCPDNSSAAVLCPIGSFCKDPSSIELCSLGAYCPPGSISDTVCPVGAFCKTPISIQNCSSGSFCPSGSTSESPCPSGYFCRDPTAMMLCPQGTFCVAKSIEPTVCQSGSLCNELGGSAAGICPTGSFCVAGRAVVCPFQSTSKEGSDSIDDCVCDAGLSLFANVSCEVIIISSVGKVNDQAAAWSVGVIAGVAVGGSAVVVAMSVFLWNYHDYSAL